MLGIKLKKKVLIYFNLSYLRCCSHELAKKTDSEKLPRKTPRYQKNSSFSRYERIRMVLEELGSTYVKLGQVCSNREDMLPHDLIR